MAKTIEKKNKGGRPLAVIDPQLVYDLAKIHCTKHEIAVIVGCHVDTLYARFSEQLHQGDEEGKKSLKRKMHEIAMNGNVSMLIWISKQRLGYRDKQPDEAPNTVINVVVNEVP